MTVPLAAPVAQIVDYADLSLIMASEIDAAFLCCSQTLAMLFTHSFDPFRLPKLTPDVLHCTLQGHMFAGGWFSCMFTRTSRCGNTASNIRYHRIFLPAMFEDEGRKPGSQIGV